MRRRYNCFSGVFCFNRSIIIHVEEKNILIWLHDSFRRARLDVCLRLFVDSSRRLVSVGYRSNNCLALCHAYGEVVAEVYAPKSMLLNALIAVAVGGGIISAVLIGLNFIDLPGTEPVYYRCKVEKSYRTEHHRSRRVGRRYVSTGETYYRYHADISLPDGKQVTVPITAGRYRTARANDSITIAVHKGMMGVDYITPKFKSKL